MSSRVKTCRALLGAAVIASGSCGGGSQPASESRSAAATETVQTPASAPSAATGAPGRIAGFVFRDTNRNGQFDANETRASKQTVALSSPDGASRIQSATTGADGSFQFENIPAGKYRLTLTMPEGFERTTDDSFVLGVGADVARPDVKFGIAPSRP